VEFCEDRLLLASYVWVGGSAGDFDAAANWADSSNNPGIPGASDDITISGDVTINVKSAAAVNTISAGSAVTINVSGGNFTVNNKSSASSTIGSMNVSAGAGLDISAGTLSLTSAATFDGLLEVAPGASLDNAGSLVWNGTSALVDTGTFNNEAGSTLTMSGDGVFAPQVNNAGMLIKSSPTGTGTTEFTNLLFNNTGTIDINSGSIQLDNDGTDTGAFDVASGASLIFSSTNSTLSYTIGPGAGWQGTGSLDIAGQFADLLFDTDLMVPNLNLAGGELDGTANLTVSGTLDWTGGTMRGSGTTTIASGATLNITGTSITSLERTLDNGGTTSWSSTASINGAGPLNNQSGGVFDMDIAEQFIPNLNNAGTVNVTTGAGAVELPDAIVNNTGTINVETGSFIIDYNGTSSGEFDVAAGAALEFGSNNGTTGFALAPGATWKGSGALEIVGQFADLLVDTDFTVPTLNLSAGAIDGTAKLTVTGTLDWTAGTMQGSGTTTIPSGATLAMNTGTDTTLSLQRTIENVGTTLLSGGGGVVFGGSGAFRNENGGAFEATSSATFGGGANGTLNNAGMFEVSPGAGGTATIEPLLFENTGTIEVQTGTATIYNADFTAGTVLSLSQASTAKIYSGSLSGGTTFNVAPNAIVDLTDGQTVTYSGTLTGSGTGTVELAGGVLDVGSGGVTLNFPGSVFQWTGGQIQAFSGDVTNLGTITLAGSNEKDFTKGGTLDDFGTIIQTGTGTLGLDGSGGVPVLQIEPTGEFVMESDAAVTAEGAASVVDNEGMVEKAAGTATSTFATGGTLESAGIIEADSGTLALDPVSLAQISGDTLTGGSWNASDGAILEFPAGTAITTSAATISLNGAGATITGIARLASNPGSLSVNDGANFITVGDFTNTGRLTLGTGSTLSVASKFIQTSSGALAIQIGGTPTSGLFGRVSAAGTTTLAGAFSLALVNGFGPSIGQSYGVMSFEKATGQFASYEGLGTLFTESLTATTLNLAVAANGVNLLPSNVSAPTAAAIGQSITVNWQVTDQSSDAVPGNWQDSVYLSTTSSITPSSILLGASVHTGGLSAAGSYNASLTAPVPAVAPGYYYVLVEIDSLYQTPDVDRAESVLVAGTGPLDVSLVLPTRILAA
jgi:hypothetical protein